RLQVAEMAIQLVVGVLADAARVQHHDVGRLEIRRTFHALGFEHARDAFRVVLVHLAAEGAHEEPAGHGCILRGGPGVASPAGAAEHVRSGRLMDVTVGALILAALATIVGATIQGSIGFGLNLVTVPVLALVLPDALPVTVVLLGIPISIAMLRHEHHALDRRGLGWIITGRVPGTIVGAWVAATVTTTMLQGLIGGFVLLFVLASILTPPLPVRPGTQVV